MDLISRALTSLVCKAGCGLHMVPLSRGVRLGIPSDREGWEKALSLYQPQRIKAKIYVRALKLLLWSGLAKVLPGQKLVGVGSQPKWLVELNSLGVLYGNPGHRAPRVIMSYKGQEGWEVSKLILAPEADSLLEREATVMKAAAAAGVPVPLVHGVESVEDGVMLRMAYVDLKGGSFQDEMALGILKNLLLDREIRIRDWIGWETVEGELEEQIGEIEVRAAIRHGDFASWNFRNSNDGLILLDWEYGEVEGPSGMDLVHLLSQRFELVEGYSSADCISAVLGELQKIEYQRYLQDAGWAGRELELMALSYAYVTATGQQDQSGLLGEVRKRNER